MPGAGRGPGWRNGRRSGLKLRGRKAWGFESPSRHQSEFELVLDVKVLAFAVFSGDGDTAGSHLGSLALK